MTQAQLDRFFHIIDQFSFEWDGIAEDNPGDPVIQDIRKKAQWIYDRIDEMRIKKMKDEE